jgi:hypothetical protein
MGQRIKMKDLDYRVEHINDLLATGDDDAFHLSCAYGGYALHRKSPRGGINDVLNTGHTAPKDLYGRMHAFIQGYMAAGE